jgi:hypothetical protein
MLNKLLIEDRQQPNIANQDMENYAQALAKQTLEYKLIHLMVRPTTVHVRLKNL